MWLCEHDKVRSVCRVCGGASICMHQIVRSTCKTCGMQDVAKPRLAAGSMQQQQQHDMSAIQSLGAGLLPAPQMLMPMPPLNMGGAAGLALQAHWLAQLGMAASVLHTGSTPRADSCHFPWGQKEIAVATHRGSTSTRLLLASDSDLLKMGMALCNNGQDGTVRTRSWRSDAQLDFMSRCGILAVKLNWSQSA